MQTNRRTQCCNRERVEQEMMRHRCMHQDNQEEKREHKDMGGTWKILFEKHLNDNLNEKPPTPTGKKKTYIAQYGDNKFQYRLYMRKMSPRMESLDRICTKLEPSFNSEIHSLLGQLFLSSCQRMFVSMLHLPLQLNHVTGPTCQNSNPPAVVVYIIN